MKSILTRINLNDNKIRIGNIYYTFYTGNTLEKKDAKNFYKTLGFSDDFTPMYSYGKKDSYEINNHSIINSNGELRFHTNETQSIQLRDTSAFNEVINKYLNLFDGFVSNLGLYTNDSPPLRYEPAPSDSDIPDLNYRAYVPIDDKDEKRNLRCYIHLNVNTNYIDLNDYYYQAHDFEIAVGKTDEKISIPEKALLTIKLANHRVFHCDLYDGINIENGIEIINKTILSQETIKEINIYYEHP